MAKPHVDRAEHGEVRWFTGYGSKETFGEYVGSCIHLFENSSWCRPIAWGWDFKHYTLEECQECGARAWHDERIRPTTTWLATHPQLLPAGDCGVTAGRIDA